MGRMECPKCHIENDEFTLIKSSGKVFCPEDGCGAFIMEDLKKIDESEDDPNLEKLET